MLPIRTMSLVHWGVQRNWLRIHNLIWQLGQLIHGDGRFLHWLIIWFLLVISRHWLSLWWILSVLRLLDITRRWLCVWLLRRVLRLLDIPRRRLPIWLLRRILTRLRILLGHICLLGSDSRLLICNMLSHLDILTWLNSTLFHFKQIYYKC